MTSDIHIEDAAAARRIAVVDDEEDLVAIFTVMIQKCGHTLEMVASDRSDVTAAIADRRIRPDIVLMDYRMKTMNGVEAAKRIHILDPSIRIIIISADDSTRLEVMDAGLAFLQKPCSLAQLKRAISAA